MTVLKEQREQFTGRMSAAQTFHDPALLACGVRP
jgi:hypothetical protein